MIGRREGRADVVLSFLRAWKRMQGQRWIAKGRVAAGRCEVVRGKCGGSRKKLRDTLAVLLCIMQSCCACSLSNPSPSR